MSTRIARNAAKINAALDDKPLTRAKRSAAEIKIRAERKAGALLYT